MPFRSTNVTIEPRNFFPWSVQKIQVDGKEMFGIKRSYGLSSVKTSIYQLSTKKEIAAVRQTYLHRSRFEVSTPGHFYKVKKHSYWQWECRCKTDVILVNRLSGIKCVLSQDGNQLAIMSLNTNLPFMNDRNTYVRVNHQKHLYLSITVALMVKGFGIDLNPLFLNNNKLSPIRPVELA